MLHPKKEVQFHLLRLAPHPNLPPKGKEHNFSVRDTSLRSV
nr:MAG TPA: hypothetical protein [Caudoviricetes sp.]